MKIIGWYFTWPQQHICIVLSSPWCMSNYMHPTSHYMWHESVTHHQWNQCDLKYDASVTWPLNMQVRLLIHFFSLTIARNGLKVWNF
jgi:hypothetical protein